MNSTKSVNGHVASATPLLYTTFIAFSLTASAQPVQRTEPIPLDSQYVAVDLNALANHQGARLSDQPRIVSENIPFDLAWNGANNNLFLHRAGWPDWQTDPLAFYAAYDQAPEKPTDTLPVVQIPTDDYSAVYILASCENDAKYSNVLSLRIGAKKGTAQTTYRDFEFEVPRARQDAGKNVVRVLPGESGNLFLMRLPLHAALSQEFSNHRALDVEITKKIRLSIPKPDAARFQYRPLGLPSGVHLYGMTFERAPVRLALRGAQTGNVFSEPQIPSFQLELQGAKNHQIKNLKVRAQTTDYYGNVQQFPAQEFAVGALSSFPSFTRNLKLPVSRRGYYTLTITVEGDGKVLLTRRTTFALLPPNTRKFVAKSPFGTWDFGGTHHTPDDADMVGPLYVKAGLRYGMFNFTGEELKRYGVVRGNDPVTNLNNYKKLDEQIATMKAAGQSPAIWMFFHEDVISGNHVTRTPDAFTGKSYQLNVEEQKKFTAMMNVVVECAPKIRRAFPHAKLYLGNGTPQLMEEFLRHKLPAETFDVLGNEAASFQRLPESQPTDFVANNASLWMEHYLLNHYGYKDKGVAQAYEVIYPSSNPGNLTLSQQADYVVRNAMHSLAWRVPVIRFSIIADPGNSYYFSSWGATGLMFGRPEFSPKPLYVAVATMTQMLDGARFSRIVPTGSTTVYAFEFKKTGGELVTCIWTPSTSQEVSIQSSEAQLVATDLMFNPKVLPERAGRSVLMTSGHPVFVESKRPLKIRAGKTSDIGLQQGEESLISAMDDATQWQLVNGQNNELEAYNFMQPRRHAPFEVKGVAEFEGRKKVMQIKPLHAGDAQWWIPCYTQLMPKEPVAVKGRPTHVGLMVNGNGGWGQIIFEFEDAAGQRWISLGTEQEGKANPWLADWMSQDELAKMQRAGVSDWNSNDVWGRSMINFNGWRYLQFPLPGNYPGEGYHWPYTSQWRCVQKNGAPGDYKVLYPLKFTKLAVTARSKILYGTEVVPVERAEIYLKDLGVTYGDPDSVFWQPDNGQK